MRCDHRGDSCNPQCCMVTLEDAETRAKYNVVGSRSRMVGGDFVGTWGRVTMSRRRGDVGWSTCGSVGAEADQRPEALAILRHRPSVSYRVWRMEVIIVDSLSSIKAGRMLSQSISGALGIHVNCPQYTLTIQCCLKQNSPYTRAHAFVRDAIGPSLRSRMAA